MASTPKYPKAVFPKGFTSSLDRRALMKATAASSMGLGTAAILGPQAFAQDDSPVDTEQWNPETIQALAGTIEVDTTAEMHELVPADHSGSVSWGVAGPNQAAPQVSRDFFDEFQVTFGEIWPEIELEVRNDDYNTLLDNTRVAAEGGSAPATVKFPILWGVEFAGRGWSRQIDLAEYGFTEDSFWPGAIQSCMFEGNLYGIPTNNETMAFIYNADLLQQAGFEEPPATWEAVREVSKAMSEISPRTKGYGMVARQNAGNTPFRFMPTLWAFGGSALDEAEDDPTYTRTLINSDESIAALQLFYDMYVTDRSVPTSALTNTQTENQDLFITQQIGMMISHPSEYVTLSNNVAEMPEGEEKERAQSVVDNMVYTLIPEGPVRRAVVFGGSNAHILTEEATGGPIDEVAARALVGLQTSAEWALKNNWADSNPGNLRGFETEFMAQRLEQIRFLDVTTSMLPYGIPFPVVPESTEIMNVIIPDMIQNALTETMSVQEAADDAAGKIQSLIDGRS